MKPDKPIYLVFAFLFCLSLSVVIGTSNPATIQRSLSSNSVLPGDILTVNISVEVVEGVERYYILEEIPPSGWRVLDTGGLVQGLDGGLRLVVLSGATDTVYTYTLMAPKGPFSQGTYNFDGEYQVEGMGSPATTTGISNVNVTADWTVEDNRVYVDDSKVFIQAEPHTINWPSWVYFNITSKVYTGNVDLIAGFNTSIARPKAIQIYNPHEVTKSYTCDCENCWYNYTTSPKHFYCWFNESDNGTIYSIYDHAFDSADLGIKTAYWTEIEDYQDVNGALNSINYEYGGMNKWWYKTNIPITQDADYQFRVFIDPTGDSDNKYWVCIKPSTESLSEAISSGHLYCLDPWYDEVTPDNFNLYTEVDPGSDITITNSTHIDFTNMDMGEQAYVNYDAGAGYFSGDFSHNFTYAITSYTNNPSTVFWGLSNQSDDRVDWTDGINFQIYRDGTGSGYVLLERVTPTYDYCLINAVSSNTYYVNVKRTGSTMNLTLYTDKAHTTQAYSCTVTDGSTYRYIYALSTFKQTGRSASGWMSELYTGLVPLQNITVNLDSPADDTISYTSEVTFKYAPAIQGGYFDKACLWADVNTTWSEIACNSTALINGSINNISYTFNDIRLTNFEWSIMVTGNEASIESSKRTLTVLNGTMTSPQNTTYGSTNVNLAWTTPNDNFKAIYYSLNGGANQSISYLSYTDFDNYSMWTLSNPGNYITLNDTFVNITNSVDQDYGAYTYLYLNTTEHGLDKVREFDINWTQESIFGNQTSIGPPAQYCMLLTSQVDIWQNMYQTGMSGCEIQGYPGVTPTYARIRNYETWDDGGYNEDACDCSNVFFDWGYMRMWRSLDDINNITLEAYNDSAHTTMHCACHNVQYEFRDYELVYGFIQENVSGSDIRTWSGYCSDINLGIENKTYWNTTITASVGQNNITIYMNNSDGELVSQTAYFTVTTADTTPPTIDSVNYILILDPTESSNSILTLNFTATDPNLNDTTSSAIVSNGATTRSNTSCESTVLGGNQTRYDCNIALAYYDPNGTWAINVSISDDYNNLAYNDTESFTYNQLNAFTINTSTLNYGSISIGENKTSQFYLNNTGNINLTTEISGTNLTNSTDQIDVSNLKWDLDSNPSDGTTMTTSFTSVGSLAIISIQNIWIELTIPIGTLPKVYSGTINLQS